MTQDGVNSGPSAILSVLVPGRPAIARRWLDMQLVGDGVLDPDFNWEGFTSVSASMARRAAADGQPDEARAWARITIDALEQLARYEPKGGYIWSAYLERAMWVRAGLIRDLGPVPGDAVLDPQRIIDSFVDALPGSLEDIRNRAPRVSFTSSTAEELMALRRLKARLVVIEFLVKECKVEVPQSFFEWLLLRDALP